MPESSSCPTGYSWFLCGVCLLILFCAVGLPINAYSVNLNFLREHWGFTPTQCSWITTVKTIANFLTLFFVDRMLSRLGVRRCIVVGALLSAASFALPALLKSYGACCIGAVLGGLGYTLAGPIPAAVVINAWFPSRSALALGISSSGSGVATIVAPPLLTALILRLSLPAAYGVEAMFVLAVAVLAWVAIREKTDGPVVQAEAYPTVLDERSADHCGCRLVCVSTFFLGICCAGSLANFALLLSSTGYGETTAAYLLSVAGIALVAGKCLFGALVDRIRAMRTSVLFFLTLLLGMGMCALTGRIHNVPFATVGMAVWGIGNALSTVGLATNARELVDPAPCTSMMKYFQIAFSIGAITAGPFPGILYRVVGNYTVSYILFFLAAALSFLLFLLAIWRQTYLARVENK